MDSMLNTLRRIVQEVNRAATLHDALEIIVSRIKRALEVDACSVFLNDEQNEELVLLATDGLLPTAVGRVKIPIAEGLVGWVAKRAEPINIVGASNHPRYSYFPETGEEQYDIFLGVPIIHHRQLLGVLALQQSEGRFSEEVESFLITIASQLAGAIAHAVDDGHGRDAEGGDPVCIRPLDGQELGRAFDGLEGRAGAVEGVAAVPLSIVYPGTAVMWVALACPVAALRQRDISL